MQLHTMLLSSKMSAVNKNVWSDKYCIYNELRTWHVSSYKITVLQYEPSFAGCYFINIFIFKSYVVKESIVGGSCHDNDFLLDK